MQNTLIHGGLPEEYELHTLIQLSSLMRKKYSNYQRYLSHKTEQVTNTIKELFINENLLGELSNICKYNCTLNVTINLPLDKWPFSANNGIPFAQGSNILNSIYPINLNYAMAIDMSQPFSRYINFHFIKEAPIEIASWLAKVVFVENLSDNWREGVAGIAIADTTSGLFFGLFLSNSAVYAIYARSSPIINSGRSQFIAVAKICSRKINQKHNLQLKFDESCQRMMFIVDDMCGITIDDIGLVPGLIYKNELGEKRCYNTSFTTVKSWDVQELSANDRYIPISLYFGFGILCLVDINDIEYPDAKIHTSYDCNIKCNLYIADFSLGNIKNRKLICHKITDEFSELLENGDNDTPKDWQHFFTMEEIYRLLEKLCKQYPKICHMIHLGDTPKSYGSVADIPINAICAGSRDPTKPHILIVSGLHAREKASINPSLAYFYWFVCSNSSQAIKLRSESTLVYLPLADPASYVRDDAWTVWDPNTKMYINVPGKFLRKNSNYVGTVKNGESGVDIDRNFGTIRDISDKLVPTGTILIPREWMNDSKLSCNGTWGLSGSSDNPESPIYRGPNSFMSSWLGKSGHVPEIETLAIQRLCQLFPFRAAIIHTGIGYRLTHPQFPDTKLSSSPWTVSPDDICSFTRLCHYVANGTRYTACTPHVPASGTAIDWIYTAGQLRSSRYCPNLGTLSLVAETGDKFYPDFTEMKNVVNNGAMLNYAIHIASLGL